MQRPEWFAPPKGLGDWVGFVGGIVVAVCVLAFIGWTGVRLAQGSVRFEELYCGFDPTDPCNYSVYRVRNDTNRAVLLGECDERCQGADRGREPILIEAGGITGSRDYEVKVPIQERAWWQVETRSGQRIGCLVLDGHPHKHDGDIVLVSAAQRCSMRSTTPIYRVAR
jgi:hypothetical protein